jgi:hypothetical protein
MRLWLSNVARAKSKLGSGVNRSETASQPWPRPGEVQRGRCSSPSFAIDPPQPFEEATRVVAWFDHTHSTRLCGGPDSAGFQDRHLTAKAREISVEFAKFLFIPTMTRRLVPEYDAESNNCFTVSLALRFTQALAYQDFP